MARWWHKNLEGLQLQLANQDALLPLALLGCAAGIISGVVIVAFRLLVEESQAAFFPGGESENFEGLGWQARMLLPLAGGLILIAMFRWGGKGIHVLGVARVMERMAYHQGYLKLRGLLLQFFGAATAIIGGFSVGREGPHVYLGAAGSSLMGQWLNLPNNTIRTLVGCGTAAGIAASFNTPLAGVIFALEVVMLEYTLASFIPVILAAASATLVSIAVFGNAPAFDVSIMRLSDLLDLFFILMLGVAAGILSAGFIHMVQTIAHHSRALRHWQRLLLATLTASLFGLLLPQVMGIGYDTVDRALTGSIGLSLLALLVIGKLLATSACIGLGIPGGMIGPALFIGAMLGSLFSQLSALAGIHVDPGFFALLGMGAMMGASLQAPLAALVAMMELTYTPGIIMPGMVVVVIASLTSSELFGKESLFITMLKASGMDYTSSPVHVALRSMGVAGAMSKSFVRSDAVIDQDKAATLLEDRPVWILINGKESPLALLRAADLASYMEKEGEGGNDGKRTIDLMDIPGRRLEILSVHIRATLLEAREILDRSSLQALYVQRQTAPGIHHIYGILTREMIESAYQ
ncbi:MAG TPA: chloride channel protein [Gammaproteobacteria bacterium]|nr:chloride channel protein [Gammaproteobacteria bacterium]